MKHNSLTNSIIFITLFLMILSSHSIAKSASTIELEANEAIKQFGTEVKGGEAFLSKVKAYLIFPSVMKGGFIVGGEYGEGALRIDGETKHYYSMASGSIGFQAGLQKISYLIAFASQDALNNFLRSNGQEATIDTALTVADWGIGRDISSISFEEPIYVFVFGAKGLMGGISLKGTEFIKITPN